MINILPVDKGQLILFFKPCKETKHIYNFQRFTKYNLVCLRKRWYMKYQHCFSIEMQNLREINGD